MFYFYAYYPDSGDVLERLTWPTDAELVIARPRRWNRTPRELRELFRLVYALHHPLAHTRLH